MYLGDTVVYKGKIGKVTGFKDDKLLVELKANPYIPGISDVVSEIITVKETELEVIESADEYFLILTQQGMETKKFLTLKELTDNIKPEQLNKATVYEVKKLGKIKAGISSQNYLNHLGKGRFF